MSSFPEPRLEPPEADAVGSCAICDNDIAQGEPCWKYEGKLLCRVCIPDDVAEFFGCHMTDNQE